MKRAIVLVDHGSRREEANLQLHTLCERIAALRPLDLVRPAHMEILSPTLAEAVEACVAEGACEIVVQPCFLAPGRHTSEDIPQLIEEAVIRHPDVLIYSGAPIGADDKLIEILLARVDAARG